MTQPMKPGFIYIITNKNNTTLYIGVTSNLPNRIMEHKEKRYQNSFSARYNLNKLVYFEQFQMIGDAIGREKQLKAGNRANKEKLINSINPDWNDLYEEISDIMII
jgi:putative endonuclease